MPLWSDIVTASFEGYVFLSYFYRMFEREYHFLFFIPAYLFYVAGMCVLRKLDATPVAFVFFGLLSVMIFSFIYKATFRQKALYSCFLVFMNIFSEIICGYILIEVFHLPVNNITEYEGFYITGSVISKLTFFLLVRLVCRIHHGQNKLPLKLWAAFMMIPVVSIAAVHGLALTAAGSIIEIPIAAFMILGGIISINMMAFILYDTLSGQSKRLIEHEMAKSRAELEMQRYETIIRQGRDMGAVMHEIHRHLRILASLSKREEYDDAKKYILKLYADVCETEDGRLLPDYPALDVVLRQKIFEAESHGINVTHEVSLVPGLAIEPVEMCVILGNALDNAIEACAALTSERRIDIQINFLKNRLSLVISNTSKPVEIVDGMCKTTKADSESHGYGFSNMKRAVEKYRGNIMPSYQDGMFILRIIIMN